VAHRIKEMDGELKELVARAPPEKAVRPLAETGPRDLTFEEKRKLSIVRTEYWPTTLCNAAVGCANASKHSQCISTSL
jgi:hypothetical protein